MMFSHLAILLYTKQFKSASIFCRQVAAWFLDMFCHFYFVKNHKFVSNLRTSVARVKIGVCLEYLEFLIIINVCFSKYKSNQILLHKISHRFLATTKLLLGETPPV
jgi:hypothetical protein